jgi:flavin-dependent dehydrogenase
VADVDVIIAGGGPAGSVLAARLSDLGKRVMVLERERFPRFHLGESLLPGSMGALSSIGVFEECMDRFLVKRGAHFHDFRSDRTVRFDFRDAFHTTCDHAFQVPRDEFDELLLRNAGRKGADVREGWTTLRAVMEGGRAAGVVATDPDGKEHSIGARFVVDATGRDALLCRARQGSRPVEGLDKTALYAHFRGVERDTGEREGDIQIVVFPPGWLWFIPFKDGRTSVGAVVSRAWMKGRGEGESVPDLYARALAESKVATRMLADAEALWPARAAADFSFRVRDVAGDGWLAVGDSGGFIDPLFSTGAHLAIDGAVHAATAIGAALDAGDVCGDRFAPWARRVDVGTSLFLEMLSWHVYDEEARWIREVRTRFGGRAHA